MFCKFFKLTVALFTLLFACELNATPELHAQKDSDTLVLWVMDQDINSSNTLQKLIRKFTQATGVNVKVRFLDWSYAFDKIENTLRKNYNEIIEYPDVLQLGSSWVPFFANKGLIEPVTELAAIVDTSRFLAGAMRSAHIGSGNEIYAFPWFLDVRGFFANERILRDLKISENDIDSYNKFFGVLRAIANVKNNINVVPFEFGVKDDWTGYQQMAPVLWNFGGDFVLKDNDYRSALVDSLTLIGLAHYLKFLCDIDVSPYNLTENSAQSVERFVDAKQLMLFGTSELIRKLDFDIELGGLKGSMIEKDGLITLTPPSGPAGNFTFVGGSHLAIPKNSDAKKRENAYKLFLFMLRTDNIDFYSRQSGFIPADKGLISIWKRDKRYSHLVDNLEHSGRTCLNIPEWSEIEITINKMVNEIAADILKNKRCITKNIAKSIVASHNKVNKILNNNKPFTDYNKVQKIIETTIVETPYTILREQNYEQNKFNATPYWNRALFKSAIILFVLLLATLLKKIFKRRRK